MVIEASNSRSTRQQYPFPTITATTSKQVMCTFKGKKENKMKLMSKQQIAPHLAQLATKK